MPVPIASLFVSVSADVSAAVNGLNSLNRQVSATAQQFRDAAPAALLLEGAAVGIGAALATSVNVAADFEHQMSGVKAVLSTDEISQFGQALSDLALTLGRDTTFTSREAAAAIEELIKAGVPAQAVLEGAGKAALDLAAATGVTTTEAATIASQAMNTFGVQASDLTGVVDRLAAVANASASDVSFLRFGLAAVGGVAAGLGLDLNDTVVTLGLLSNRFATGSDAGTSFKAFLNGLIPDTKKQVAEFRALGLVTEDGANAFFDAAGNLRNMTEIAGVLRNALQGLTSEQRQQALTTLFGTDGQRAANAIFELGAEAVGQFKEQTGASGVAAKSAQIRLDNLQGAMSNLGGSFETAQIIVGNLFLPVLRDLAARARTAVDAFTNLSPETQRLATFIVAGTGAFLGFIGAMVLIGALLPPLIVSFGALNAILFANPIGLIVTALAALVIAATVAFNTNEEFRNSVLALWDTIQNRLFPAILTAATAVREALAPIFETLSQRFGDFIATVGPAVIEFFQTQLPQALASLGTQLASLEPLFSALGSFFGALFNVIGSLASFGGTALGAFFTNVLVPGLQSLQTALAPLRPLVDALGPGLATLGSNIGLIGDKLQPVVQFFTDAASKLNDLAGAIQRLPIPGFLQPGAPAPAQGAAGVVQGAAATGGAAAGGDITVSVTTGPITGEGDENRLAQMIAASIAGAARRVSAPPDTSPFPALVP